MKTKALVSVTVCLGLLLLASVALAAVFYPEQSVGIGNTDTWVMNVHETLDANVVASFLDRNGYASADRAETITPLWHASFVPSESGLSSGWLGSMTIDSLRPIVDAVEAHWVEIPRGDGYSAAAYIDAAQGGHEIFYPALSKTGYWRSITTIQCLDTEDCHVYMTYRNRVGTTITGSPFEDTIESFSQETYDLWDPSVNPHIPEQQHTPSPWYGSLQVTSTQEIAGVAQTHCRKGHASAYNACFAGTDTTLYFPSVGRRNFNGDWSGQSDWSNISVQNTNAFAIAIHLDFYKRDGNPALGFSDSLDPYESVTYNMQTDARFAAMVNPFSGSAVVTSAYPIVGSCSGVRVPLNGVSAAYTAVTEGSSELAFPIAYRVKEGSAWRKYSGVVVHNPDPQNAITVHVRWFYYDQQEEFQIIEFDDSIPANGSHGYNTRYDGETPGGAATLQPLGNSWSGTVVVTTASPLGVTGMAHSTVSYTTCKWLTNYNGIPVE